MITFKRILLGLLLVIPLSGCVKGLVGADAGDNQSVSQGDQVSLVGEGKFKNARLSRVASLSYHWTQIAGTTVVLEGADSDSASFTAPAVASTEEILTFELTVSTQVGRCNNAGSYTHSGIYGRCLVAIAKDTVDVTVAGGEPEPLTSTVQGRITDVAGNVVSAAIEVLQNGTSVLTSNSDAQGRFDLTLEEDKQYVLKLSAQGFAAQSVPIQSPGAAGKVFFDITMIAAGAPQSFQSAESALMVGSDGAQVNVQPNSFVNAAGNLVNGDIQVTITPVDVSRAASLAAFPGDFVGIQESDGTETPIISLGTVEYEFTQNGQPLQLAPGVTANIEIPIYIDTYQDGSSIQLGDQIPLWSLNEDTGIWLQEGYGTVVESSASPTGMAMAAEVSHFTWWNCDVVMNRSQAIITVLGNEPGTVRIKATTTANLGWSPTTAETIADIGEPTGNLYIPSEVEVCFSAEIMYANGLIGTTSDVCINAAPNALVNVELEDVLPLGPVSIVTEPATLGDEVNLVGYINFPVDPLYIRSGTRELFVDFTLKSGQLPEGISILNQANDVSASLMGIPTQAGMFSADITARDTDGNEDTITVNYEIYDSNIIRPPSLNPYAFVQYVVSEPLSIDLLSKLRNFGGSVSHWEVSTVNTSRPLPEGSYQLVGSILTLNIPIGAYSCRDPFTITVLGKNVSGESSVLLRLYDEYCELN
ncbi:carboxypeptidase-like regulatory domain-containing protein [Neptunomonas concharum]|uniref:Carboxypeptidase regulatory-like domain-containing protein n=1 Tax=Neptunomonas concharum TaxID=1031538 RepID=A0A5P1R8Z5_9GAMM|nr:carboxypeptidase-like regulatory domain-containing protein [Neptunomonas concharum]QEQ96100.1 carboxypeptidase regulatory-like domain-containing protein [Neptunomonas concharum]